MRAAGYIRVSSKHQTENESLDTQGAQIRGFATANQWELIEPIYKDAGVSGRKSSRPGIDQLMTDAANNAFDVVLVADLSRFGRSTKDVLNNVDKLKKANVKFVSMRERLDGTGPYGEFMLQVFSAIAELESKTIELRTRENRESLVEQRKRFIGGLPYGYGRKPKQYKDELLEIILFSEEVQIYNKIVEYYLDLKMSIEGLVAELNRLGHRSRTGRPWNSTTMNNILRHPAYYLGILQTRAGEKAVTFECPKLISKARWDDIQKKLVAENRRPGRPDNKSATHLLNKLLYCGICGSRMASNIERGTGHRFYSCYWHELSARARKSRNKQYCPQPRHDADDLEEQVMKGLVQDLLSNPTTLVLTLVEQTGRKDDLQGKITRLQAELNGCQNRIKNIGQALNSPNLSSLVIAHHNETLAASLEEKARIFVELDEAKVEVGRRDDEAKNTQLLMDFLTVNKERLDEYRDYLMNLPFQEKQKLIRGLLRDDKIILHRGDLWVQDDRNVGRGLHTFGDFTQQELDNPENIFVTEARWRFNLPILKDILKDKFASSETPITPKEIGSHLSGKEDL